MIIKLNFIVRIWLVVMIFGLSACGERGNPKNSDAAPQIAAVLMLIEGQFEWRQDINRYVYSGMTKIESIIATRKNDATVSELINCIDDQRASHSILAGKPVAVGVVCYQALSQLVSHEETGREGDVVATWAGHISPTAKLDELISAKMAWQQVWKEKTYGFL